MEKYKEKEDFYYHLLHIRKEKQYIESIIAQNRDKFSRITEDMEGLCKICTNHIAIDFEKIGIDYKIINLKKDFGLFDHECILVRFKEDDFVYLLVDISFGQFLPKTQKINSHLKDYPARLLAKTKEGYVVVKNLQTKGFSQIDDNTLNQYINSFSLENNQIKVTKEDFFLQKYK